ncbi:hypothetical protein Cob_v009082 [Colletotrichum orbiculare MAFF 240422]|uniref:Major royal jelly protein n=1 Tax=Colletotrichum orbiculare (strain 104-T / ATCC 96160 / CBS 514.97 / LARS 414 / MAFF 240422) TaxID=1213857 RepID=A0A484FMA7_COLOR|nr:hypothetical protein Cob_v009082 [Colletotrichum orbiculare MAFF 240422]
MVRAQLAVYTALAGIELACSQDLISDSGRSGPPLELVHLYNDQWPTGIAVSSTGRKFSNYPGGLDPNNTNDGSNGKYTVAELFENNTERAYPSDDWNSPPGGAINFTTTPPTGANHQDHLIGVQSVVIDSANRLWILDTGRVQTPEGVLVTASVGGPKLIGVDLESNSVIKTIVFPDTVAYPDSYLNDVRFDLNPNLTTSGQGVAYITDSSNEGRTGLITVDLGSGESWRHLDGSPHVQGDRQFLAFVWGRELYAYQPGRPASFLTFGADGIALGADGEKLYFGGVGNRYLYSIPTERLRDNGPTSEIKAQAAVVTESQKGLSDGFETDTNGFIYHGNFEANAVNVFNPANGTDRVFLRDPRINWADTFSVATDGFIYFTNNQLAFGPSIFPGTDLRQRPFSLFRAQLPNGGTCAAGQRFLRAEEFGRGHVEKALSTPTAPKSPLQKRPGKNQNRPDGTKLQELHGETECYSMAFILCPAGLLAKAYVGVYLHRTTHHSNSVNSNLELAELNFKCPA